MSWRCSLAASALGSRDGGTEGRRGCVCANFTCRNRLQSQPERRCDVAEGSRLWHFLDAKGCSCDLAPMLTAGEEVQEHDGVRGGVTKAHTFELHLLPAWGWQGGTSTWRACVRFTHVRFMTCWND